MGKRNRVWILGAGFSYALGGPLFKDVFGPTLSEMAAWHVDSTLQKTPRGRVKCEYRRSALELYRWGLGIDEPNSMQFWRDPEEFLQRGNDALANSDASSSTFLFKHACDFVPEALRRGDPTNARDCFGRIMQCAVDELAIEVSLFLDGLTGREERWLPYLEWAQKLSERDTIVSFNYDLAVEMLFKIKRMPDDLWVVPSDGTCNADSINLHKLHGSVDWCAHHNGNITTGHTLIDALRQQEARVGILAPGPDKFAGSAANGSWAKAMQDIAHAADIFLIGYRFPESDVFAQQQIGKAIRQGAAAGRLKAVHIILGPDTQSVFNRRAQSILRGMGTDFEVSPLARNCADFFLSGDYQR